MIKLAAKKPLKDAIIGQVVLLNGSPRIVKKIKKPFLFRTTYTVVFDDNSTIAFINTDPYYTLLFPFWMSMEDYQEDVRMGELPVNELWLEDNPVSLVEKPKKNIQITEIKKKQVKVTSTKENCSCGNDCECKTNKD